MVVKKDDIVVVDKRGRQWTQEAYVNMVMKNSSEQVAIDSNVQLVLKV